MNIKRMVKNACVRYLPVSIVDSLRIGKRIIRRTKYKITQKIEPVIVTQGDLEKSFQGLGLEEGSSVCIYSSMSQFGRIEGGAATVINALSRAVGKKGCIAMPAFPIAGSGLDYLKRGLVFDLRNTPSNMGAITEAFRKTTGVVRSLHPTHSLCAKGRGAAALVEGHEDCRTPFGIGSPFWKMIEMNMDLVSFGVGVKNFTLYHTFEDLCGDKFPYSVYLPGLFSVDCVDQNGRKKVVSTPVHNPVLSQNRIDTNPEIEAKMRQLLLSGGKMRSTDVGKGVILSIKAPNLLTELHHFLKIGFTIYGQTCPESALRYEHIS